MKKNISEKKLQANRANALKSTGPRTPEGKARSSRNATTHGLTASLSARDITTLGEDLSLLPATTQLFLASWTPQTPYEASLIEELAGLRLRLKRCVRMESGLLDSEMPSISDFTSHERVNAALGASFTTQQQAFTRFSRYEANLSRAYDRTLKQLLAVRKSGLQPPPSPATPILDQTNPPPIENTELPPPPQPIEPTIRTQRRPPVTPEDSINRRHGSFEPLPEPDRPPVALVWIGPDGKELDFSRRDREQLL